ncbi:MAG: ABC transporter permease [Chloroflexota bacterium]|nr:ABC transporter permease [Chloroflexota bacterium]
MNLKIVSAIVRKDVVDAIKNKTILFSILMPIGLSILLGLALGSEVAFQVAVFDPGESVLVERLAQMRGAEIIRCDSADQVREMVEKKASGGLVLPPQFDDAVARGDKPSLQVYVNARKSSVSSMRLRQFVQEQVLELAGQELPADVRLKTLSGPPEGEKGQLNFKQYMLVTWLILGLITTGSFVVPTLLAEEKEKHTLAAILVSPASYAKVVAAKAIVGLIYSLLVAFILLVLNGGLTGNLVLLFTVVILTSLLLVEIGLLIGGFFENVTQVNTWSTFVIFPLVLPGALVMLPGAMEMVMRFIPTYYTIDAVRLALTGQATWANVWLDLAVLGGCVVALFVAVVWTLKRERA